MGAVWSDFTPVQQAWEEAFGSKPYTTHTLAIAGAPLHLGTLHLGITLWRTAHPVVLVLQFPQVLGLPDTMHV